MSRKLKHSAGSVVFIVGPTASGKTSLAVALARKIDGEIISADSMQVYKGMRVLSQAPTTAQRSGVRHHLVDLLDPSREYSAASFRRLASRAIRDIIKKGKRPIVAGGSGLYIKALVDGLFPSPKADKRFRLKMERLAVLRGSPALHKKLASVDPESAERIHPNDKRRIIRALEIYRSTGKTMTQMKSSTKGIAGKYDIRMFGLSMPREKLYSRINKRAERMFAQGAVAEAKKLRSRRLSKTSRAVLGLGEISGYLDGLYDAKTARDTLKTNTRRLAKRQLSWFGPDRRIKWLDAGSSDNRSLVRRILMETN